MVNKDNKDKRGYAKPWAVNAKVPNSKAN